MRRIAPGFLAGSLALALAIVALAGLKPAAAQRGSCFVESTAPVFNGARLGAGSLGEARERTENLGFTWTDANPQEAGLLGVVHLRRGSLNWALETGGDANLGTRTLSPAHLVPGLFGGRRRLAGAVRRRSARRASNHAIGVSA
jgi:hypothetical protein